MTLQPADYEWRLIIAAPTIDERRSIAVRINELLDDLIGTLDNELTDSSRPADDQAFGVGATKLLELVDLKGVA